MTGVVFTLILILNSAYLAATAAPTLFYLANVLLHTVGGILVLPVLALTSWRFWRWCRVNGSEMQTRLATIGVCLWGIGLLAGAGLILLGNDRPHRWLLYTHIGLCSAAILCSLTILASKSLRRAFTPRQQLVWRGALLTVGIAVGLPLIWQSVRAWQPDPFQVANPPLPPLSQDDEGMYGQAGPFHPSGAFNFSGPSASAAEHVIIDKIMKVRIIARSH